MNAQSKVDTFEEFRALQNPGATSPTYGGAFERHHHHLRLGSR